MKAPWQTCVSENVAWVINLHGYTSVKWEQDVVIALGERESKPKTVETRMAQFARKAMHSFVFSLRNVQTKLTLSYNVRVASRMFVGDALERDVMCNVVA